MLEIVALFEYTIRVQKALDIPEPCGNMGVLLVLPLEGRTPSMVWDLYDIILHT